MSAMSRSAQKVQDALAAHGLVGRVVELPDTTRSAAEAAQAVGCAVEQICKSLVFERKTSGRLVLIITGGANRVNEKALGALLAEPIRKADADKVREQTGFAIGGVPPLGHAEPLETLIDRDLLQHDQVWAAAGTPHAVFPLTPAELLHITAGRVVDVR